jgi:hypothetical protein
MSTEDDVNEDIQRVINNVRGDTNAPDWTVRGYVDSLAEQHPGVREAFIKRNEDPAAWRTIEQQLKVGFKAEARALVYDDGKRVTKKPSELASKSLPEYWKWVRENCGFDPGV